MAATTQVQILVRTSIPLRDLGVRRFGQCPWGCLQGQLAHDRLTEMLEPLGFPVNDQRAPDWATGMLDGGLAEAACLCAHLVRSMAAVRWHP